MNVSKSEAVRNRLVTCEVRWQLAITPLLVASSARRLL